MKAGSDTEFTPEGLGHPFPAPWRAVRTPGGAVMVTSGDVGKGLGRHLARSRVPHLGTGREGAPPGPRAREPRGQGGCWTGGLKAQEGSCWEQRDP